MKVVPQYGYSGLPCARRERAAPIRLNIQGQRRPAFTWIEYLQQSKGAFVKLGPVEFNVLFRG